MSRTGNNKDYENKICFHIQTHQPHFNFTANLIDSLYEKTNIVELGIKIYCFFDNEDSISTFNKNFPIQCQKINCINILEILHSKLDDKIISEVEPFNLKTCEKLNFQWQHKGDAPYAGIKRSYGLLHLNNLGYEFVWCLDSESLVLDKVDLVEIFDANSKPILCVGPNCKPAYFKNSKILFGWDENYDNISPRQNDFWIISTKYFSNMIKALTEKYKKPISYYMRGPEIFLYECYLYHIYKKYNEDIEVIQLEDGGLLGNTMIRRAIGNKSINLKEFANELNTLYFNKTLSYRGDILKWQEFKTKRGKELLKLLNIKIAVSNWQGNEGWIK